MNQEEMHVLACLGWTALMMAAAWLLLWLMDWLYQTAPAAMVGLLFAMLGICVSVGRERRDQP